MGFLQILCCCVTIVAHITAFQSFTNIIRNQRELSHSSPVSSIFRSQRCTNRYCAAPSVDVEDLSTVLTDKALIKSFHHVEFYCGDATNTYKRFLVGLGMELVSKSDQSTGNTVHASYVLRSGDMKMVFTAPYSSTIGTAPVSTAAVSAVSTDTAPILSKAAIPFPNFDSSYASAFFNKHGFGVKCVAVEVSDVTISYDAMIQNGATSYMQPQRVDDKDKSLGWVEYAETVLYGDVVLRLVNSQNFSGKFLPNFADVAQREGQVKPFNYGLKKFDHIVGNLWTLQPTMDNIKKATGFHDFAEFNAEVVGTVDSGLNSVVLANEDESVLMPINEPTYGTRRKSQIQTYLEQNNGEGVQHMALFSRDIFDTLRQMREASRYGGFEFMDRQPESYYDALPLRLGDSLTAEQYSRVRELGILADKDDQGVLLQIFTKPVGDRPTLFLEIIQRLGCLQENGDQRPGCGGFGKVTHFDCVDYIGTEGMCRDNSSDHTSGLWLPVL